MTRERAQPFIATTTVLTGIGFVVVAYIVSQGWTQDWDRELLLSLREPGNPDDPLGPSWFEEALAEVTALGGYTILVILSGIVLLSLFFAEKTREMWFTLAALVGGSIVSSLLKLVFDRPRPDVAEQLDKTFTSSFPSAHAMVSTLAYLTLALLAARLVEDRAVRRFLIVMAVLLALAIGASRVYLGVHWPSDVLAGWLAGACWAGIAWLAADAYSRSFSTPGTIGHSRV